MPYKHIEDKRAQARRYYRDHAETIRQRAADHYEANKNDPGFKERRAAYMRRWRNKLR